MSYDSKRKFTQNFFMFNFFSGDFPSPVTAERFVERTAGSYGSGFPGRRLFLAVAAAAIMPAGGGILVKRLTDCSCNRCGVGGRWLRSGATTYTVGDAYGNYQNYEKEAERDESAAFPRGEIHCMSVV